MSTPLRAFGGLAGFLAAAAIAQAGEITVTLNTSVLIGSPAAPFFIGFQIADGSFTGDGNNAAVVSNIQFGGGTPVLPACSTTGQGALGDLASSITESDLSVFAYCYQGFVPGSTLSFNVSYTNNVDPTGLPDEFVMVILDRNFTPIPTTGGIALLQIDFNSANPTVQVFAGDPTQPEAANGGFGIPISAPVVSGTPPSAPLLVSPSNGATGISPTPTLSWNAAAGATSYDVYFGAGGTPSFVTNTTTTSYSPSLLMPGTMYSWQIVAKSAGGSASSAIWSFTTVVALQFYPLTPCRIADTRASQPFTGQFGPPSLAADTSRTFPIHSSGCSIPSTAQAYSLNFTAVPDETLGFLSVWPAGSGYPGVSTLNSSDGSIIANAAIVPAGTSGGITVLASNPTDLIIDINGYFAPAGTSGLEFFPLTPCRIADTRSSQPFTGYFGPPGLSASAERNFPLAASPCLSGSAQAYSLNLTAVPPGPLGYLSVWPQGDPYPGVSTLNSPDGATLANAAIVPAGTGGGISFLPANATDLIIDINGKFAAGSGGLQFYPVTPCRVADTRSSQPFTDAFGPPSLAANMARTFPIQSSPCGIPSTAQAYALNMTVVPLGPLSFLSAWPAGEAYPGVSTLNSTDGFVIANAAIVPAGTGGWRGDHSARRERHRFDCRY
jgi:hypothetical protein